MASRAERVREPHSRDEELDGLLVLVVALVERLNALRAPLHTALRRGYLQVARARTQNAQRLGHGVTAAQYDHRMRASAHVVFGADSSALLGSPVDVPSDVSSSSVNNDSSDNHAIEDDIDAHEGDRAIIECLHNLRLSLPTLSLCTSPPLAPKNSSRGNSEARPDLQLNKEKEERGAAAKRPDVAEDVEEEEAQGAGDPVLWFGLSSVAPLRAAQKEFHRATECAVQLAETQLRLRKALQRIQELKSSECC